MNYPECISKCLKSVPRTVDGLPVVIGKTRVFFRHCAHPIRNGITYLYTVGIKGNLNHVRVMIKQDDSIVGWLIIPLSKCYSTEKALLEAEEKNFLDACSITSKEN